MDSTTISNWVTIFFATTGGLYAVGMTIVRVALWVQAVGAKKRVKSQGEDPKEVGRGMVTDATTVAIREVEQKLDKHVVDDYKQFLSIAQSLGRIEGKLGTKED